MNAKSFKVTSYEYDGYENGLHSIIWGLSELENQWMNEQKIKRTINKREASSHRSAREIRREFAESIRLQEFTVLKFKEDKLDTNNLRACVGCIWITV